MIGDIRGWLGHMEALLLMKLAQNRNVLEIGTFCGFSSVYMSRTAKRIITVDPFFGDSTGGYEDTLSETWENFKRYGVRDKVSVLTGKIEDVVDFINFKMIDFIFYDADHTY